MATLVVRFLEVNIVNVLILPITQSIEVKSRFSSPITHVLLKKQISICYQSLRTYSHKLLLRTASRLTISKQPEPTTIHRN